MKSVLVTGANGQLGKCIEKISSNYADIKFQFANASKLDINRCRFSEYSIFGR